MTINDILEDVDGIVPNPFTPEQKAKWIIEVDGRVNSEIVRSISYLPLVYPAAQDTVLLAPSPYDGLYQTYVEAMIAKYNKDYGEFNNLITLFNATFEDYASYYISQNRHTEPRWTAIAIDAAADTLSISNNPLNNGDKVTFGIFTGGAIPEGIQAGYVYYVIEKSGNLFKLSGSKNGAAIDITADGTSYYMEKVTPSVSNLW